MYTTSFKFFKKNFEFFKKSPYCNGHLHPIIHITAVEIPGVASKTKMPQGGQRQQQNVRERTLKSNIKKTDKSITTKLYLSDIDWESVLLFFSFFRSLLFGLIRKRTILGAWSKVRERSVSNPET